MALAARWGSRQQSVPEGRDSARVAQPVPVEMHCRAVRLLLLRARRHRSVPVLALPAARDGEASHGDDRRHFYGCAAYHERGRTVCTNGSDVPMDDANYILIEALLDDLLDQQLLADTVDEAIRILGDEQPDQRPMVDAEIARVDQERSRLVAAIAAGGALDGLLAALKERECRLADLRAQRDTANAERRAQPVIDQARARRDLTALASEWRRILANDPENARPVITMLLEGRVTITPTGRPKQWEMQGTGTLSGLFSREIFPSGWRPHGDLNGDCTRVRFAREIVRPVPHAA